MYEAEESGVNTSELDDTPVHVEADESEIYNKDDIEEAVEVTEDEDDGNPFE